MAKPNQAKKPNSASLEFSTNLTVRTPMHKTIIFIFSICILQTSGCENVKKYPPKSWWGKPQSVEKIELDSDQLLAENESSFFQPNSCIEDEVNRHVELRGESVPLKQCIKYEDLNEEAIDKKHKKFIKEHRLKFQPQWQKIKADFKNGDEIRNYAAPPLSGGYGIILVREGEIIHVYEQGVQ